MTSKANEEIIYAPIEIESADQLRALGATWDDCKTWRIGREHIKVLLVPADVDTRDFLVDELNRRHSRDLRRSRCLVPGKCSGLILCPSQNSCMNCPCGREKGVNQRQELSLDSLMEDGFDSIRRRSPTAWESRGERITALTRQSEAWRRGCEKPKKYECSNSR